MCYIIDSANVDFIRKILNIYQVEGVTTNPSIITKENTEYNLLLHNLVTVLNGKTLHVQLNSVLFEDMVIEATNLVEKFGDNLHIKIPVSTEGFKAISFLSKKGFHVTATAICAVNQGVMAALLGAEYLAIYVNRISNTGVDGNDVLKDIKTILHNLQSPTKIIGASYKSVYQITDSIKNGADFVTVGPDLFEKLFQSDITDQSIIQFTKDFKSMK
ncbi:MAG: fructose-6-phosphate aldolase [Bacilli bacterium]|nr:fructose-6-phosphate aldolase [Bacilli bacterium]